MSNKVEEWLELRSEDIKREWNDNVNDQIFFCESPIEKLFYIEWLYQIEATPNSDNIYINPQYKIGNYRVDFFITLDNGEVYFYKNKKNCFIVELDSYLWHGSTPEQFAKEKERERYLKSEQWDILRFSGREIYRDVEKCVDETMGYILQKTRLQ